MGDLDLLMAERDIQRALNHYCRGIDRRDAELLRSVYHDDAIDDHGAGFVGSADDYVTWVMDHLLKFKSSMHTLHNVVIDVDMTPRIPTARAESYCIAHHVLPGTGEDLQMDVFACRYIDRFEKRPGAGWRIAHRIVVREWRLHQPMFSEAEQPPGFALARRDRSDLSYIDPLPAPDDVPERAK